MAKANQKIENVHVDNVSRPEGRDYAIGWTIGGNRFHVWVKRGEIEETIYKNPPLELVRGQPGHFETRRLDRTSKAQAATFAAVLETLERDNLVAKARLAERAMIANSQRIAELRRQAYELRERALTEWLAGHFESSPIATGLLVQYRELGRQLDQLGAEAE